MRLTSAEVVIGILIAVFLFLARAERRRFHREAARHAGQQYRRDYQALDALIRDTRGTPRQHHGWGPGGDEPIPYQLTETIRVPEDCGCIRWHIDRRGRVTPAWEPWPHARDMAEVERLTERSGQ